MAILLLSYDILSSDDNIDELLDHAVFDEIDSMDSECVAGGVWYIETKESPNMICDRIIKVFKNKKADIEASGFQNPILREAEISLCINTLTRDNWVSLNDKELKDWLKPRGFGKETNFRFEKC